MSDYDKVRIAYDAEKDLNSYQAKQGLGPKSDSTLESGVNEMVDRKFETGIRTGREAGASGSDRKPIPEEEGGIRDDRGRLAKAGQFTGPGGPEDKVKLESERRPGDQDTLGIQDLKLHEANKADVNEAVAGAKAAFPAWRDLSPTQRGKYFHKLASLIREHEQEFARLEALSSGKPVSRYIDASVAADAFSYFAEAGWTVQGSSSWNTPGQLNITSREPYGVVAAIIPWNVPFAFFGIKIAPALAAGNTIVLKSSEKAPLTAGFPPGVVNVLSGYGPTTGAILASHMEVRCLSFTGSTQTGRKIQSYAALSNLKTVHVELGGKTPAIIFPDADLESAAAQTSFSVQIFSGQTCNANSRIYVHESVADKFLAMFKSMFGAAVLGDPLDKETPRSTGRSNPNGYFIKPTVFENAPEDAQIMKEEVFGPVVVINTFRTEEEVLAKANDSDVEAAGGRYCRRELHESLYAERYALRWL
ncbi:hypothetical protein ABHI18_006379 [Aspergillus niger]